MCSDVPAVPVSPDPLMVSVSISERASAPLVSSSVSMMLSLLAVSRSLVMNIPRSSSAVLPVLLRLSRCPLGLFPRDEGVFGDRFFLHAIGLTDSFAHWFQWSEIPEVPRIRR